MIPLLFRYPDASRPPTCKLPGNLMHPNVYPSGLVCVDYLNEEEGWTSDITLPEMLFSVQQLLAHPNWRSPAQSTAYSLGINNFEEYKKRVKDEVALYSNFVGHHPSAKDRLESGETMDGEDIIERIETGNPKERERPALPPFPRSNRNRRVLYKGCSCSCCAWGQNFWKVSIC